MKTESTIPIPTTEFLTPSGPWRFNYNQEEIQRDKITFHTADYVETAELTKENIVVALIRTRYSMNDEAALHRKSIANEAGAADEFTAYNDFVNECKNIVKSANIL